MTPVLGIVASSNQQGRSVGNTGSYEVIATSTVVSGGVTSLTFAGIPVGYRNLELYWNMATSVADRDLYINFNGDTSAIYQNFILYANTSGGMASFNLQNQTKLYWGGGTTAVNTMAPGTTTFFNVSSTSTYKSMQAIYSYSANSSSVGSSGASSINHAGGQYASFNPITSITLSVFSGVINEYSNFTLYGVL